MSIREELGITADQFRRLKEEIVKEIVSPKKKQYWMTACSLCGGDGNIVEKTSNYRVFERLQDENLGCVDLFNNLREAEKYVVERTAMPLGECSMFTIVAPDGELADVSGLVE